MSRYEVIAHAKPARRLSEPEYVALSLTSYPLDRGLRFQRLDELPDGKVAIVLQHKTSARKQDQAYAMAQRTLFQLGITATEVERVDLHRVSANTAAPWSGRGSARKVPATPPATASRAGRSRRCHRCGPHGTCRTRG